MSQGFTGKNFTFQRWDGLYHPIKNLSLNMSTFTTTYNWATGTSTNNLITLTTDASADGTGALLFVGTGASSTVTPLLVKSGSTTALTVNTSAQVLIGTLTNGRVTYAGSSGLLQDSANMTFDGSKLSLATTGSSGGLLIGGDANLYRSAADTLKTDDSLIVGTNLSVLNAGTLSLYESGSVNFSSFAAGTQAADLRYTLPTSQPTTNQVLTATSVTGSGPYDISLGWVSNSTDMAIGGAITSGTTGSVLFVGSGPVLAQDNANFYWDDTNNTFGIGTTRSGAISGTNPSMRILGTGTSSATSSFEVQNSSAATILFVRNDGRVGIGTNAPSGDLAFGGAAARTIYHERATSGAGNILTIQSGGAQSGATDTNGGKLVLSSGIATGTGSSAIEMKTTAPGGSTGSADVNPTTSAYLTGAGLSLWTTTQTYSLTFGNPTLEYPYQATVGPLSAASVGANSLLITSGNMTGGTDLDGGSLTLKAGDSTGAGTSEITFYTATPGGTGTTVRTSSQKMRLNGAGQLQVSTTGSSAGVVIGGDTQLYRSAADVIRTPDSLVVDASLTVGTLTSSRVTYAGTAGLLQDSANMTFDGSKLSLATTGSSGGLLIGGDANLYRSAADVLKTDDSFVVGVNLSVLNAGTFSLYESGSVNFSSFAAGTQAADLRYTLPTSQPSTNQVLTATAVSGTGPYDVTLGWAAPTSSISIGSTVTSGTAGSVLFVGSGPVLAQDNSNLYFDDTNDTLGVGTTRSGAISATNPRLRVKGSGATSSTSSFEVQDSGGGTSLFVRDDGWVGIGINAPIAKLNIAGNVSAASWFSTGGIAFRITAATYTDTSSSGTVASNWVSSVRSPTLAASSSTTFTDAATFHIQNVPTAGSNVVLTRAWTLYTEAGQSYLGDGITIGDVTGTAARISIGGNYSASAWGVLGVVFHTHAMTLTDTSSSGTVATVTANSFSTPTLAASSVTTYTDAANVYIANAPAAGSNVTLTNSYALWVDSGATRLDGNLIVGSLTSTRIPYASTGGLLVDSANMTFNGTRLALATTGNTGGLLIGGDTNLYRSSADVLATDDTFLATSLYSYGNIISESGYISSGQGSGGALGEFRLLGDSSGTISIFPQTDAGTYNFNLPTTAGSSGYVLTSGGGGTSPMTWTAPGALAVRWNSLANPTGNLSLTMSTNLTTFNWATGTSTNNLFSLTTDASANGTGALLNIATGASATVLPLLVKAGATTGLTVNASAQVLVGTLTSTRVTYAGTNGLLQDSANMTFDGNRLALATTGNTGGLLIGGDANLYRSAADVLKTDDSLIVGTNLSVLNAGTFSLYESGSVNFSSFAAGTQAADLRYTLPTSQPSTNHVLTATAISGSGPYDITLGWAAPSATISIGSSITSGTAGSVLFVGAGAVLAQDNNNFFWDDTNNYLGLGTAATPAARLHVTGNQTAAAWTTNGVLLRVGAATLTDSSSTGTVAASVANAIQTPTFAASSSTTYTDAATLYISANPTAGTNVTITNGYALWVDSGATRLDGNLIVGSLTSTRIPYASTGGLLVDSANMTFNGTRLALATTGNTGGLLIGGDTNLYRSAADTITTDDAFIAQSLLAYAYVQAEGYLSAGLGGGGTTGQVKLLGDTTGTVTIQPQSNAGTYNFNLPITAGSSGEVLTSAGGGGTAMTWTAPGALAVRWSSLANPTGNLSLTMSTNTTTFNWATGTSTNNLLSLTTDASANGTGALLNIATGTSATVIPLLVKAGATTGLTVNASAQVLVGTLTSTRVTYAGTNGLLQDSANMTFDGNRLALATTGNTGGLLIGGDANLYRSAADTLKTDDAFVTASTLTGASSLTLGAASGTTGSILIKGTTSGTVTVTTAAAAGTWTLTLPTSGGTSGNVLRTDGSGTTSWVAPGIPWTEVTGTSQSASANNGYVTNNAALVTVTLPTPAVGSVVEIVGIGAGGWKAQCASSHTIRLGTIVSAATGYAASTNQYDSIRIVGISTTAWSIVSVVGTIDVV